MVDTSADFFNGGSLCGETERGDEGADDNGPVNKDGDGDGEEGRGPVD